MMDNNINANSLNSLLCYVGVRFKNLGTSITEEQLNAIANGDFSDLWNGDYWVNGGITWRIVDNTSIFYKTGDTVFTKPHLVVMPDTNLLNSGEGTGSWMNDTATTEGGYYSTKYRSTYRSQCKALFANCFGSANIATHRELLCNSVSNGQASGVTWADADVELPSECNIYGHNVWTQSTSTNGGGGYNTGINLSQFAFFRLSPKNICTGQHYWLRDIVNATSFSHPHYYGFADFSTANWGLVGLRPYAIIAKGD